MPAAKSGQYTARQVAQLGQLLEVHALSREGAKHQFDEGMAGCSPLVIGKLRDLGLAESRVTKAKTGSQVTAYWLTESGARVARKLAEPPPPRDAEVGSMTAGRSSNCSRS